MGLNGSPRNSITAQVEVHIRLLPGHWACRTAMEDVTCRARVIWWNDVAVSRLCDGPGEDHRAPRGRPSGGQRAHLWDTRCMREVAGMFPDLVRSRRPVKR